ncbi:hypothetical protein E1B28_012809 [Marasmius oreades]|uniref:Uncharacterized protein n=1 Tax=Marasmius oreades TaxID=181124 RepID=A0A9P7RT25_9AGAR|nr:uncharacterized protein E1B28_012809 [Marasmius oreades]KAG7088855.1 hypothetical protein E1B28_012809 [Marasmius oreades]
MDGSSQPPSSQPPAAYATVPNSPSEYEYDRAFPLPSESMLHAAAIIEQREQQTLHAVPSSDSAEGTPLPHKRLLTPKKNAPSSIRALAAQRKAEAEVQFPSASASTPPRLSRLPLRSPFAANPTEPSQLTESEHQYTHPFGVITSLPYQGHPQFTPLALAAPPQPSLLAVPSGYRQSEVLSGISSEYPTGSGLPPFQATTARSMPATEVPAAEEIGGRPTKTEAQVLQELFAEMDSLLEKLAERLSTTPDLLLSRYLVNDSHGRMKGKDNPWNSYQQWVLNDDTILVQEMQRLEGEVSEDVKWDSQSQPTVQQLRLTFAKFKEEVEDWDEVLREASAMKALLPGQLQRYRRKAFESIFQRIKALLETSDHRYGFSGVVLLAGNQINEDQSLAHVHTTSKVKTFAEDCCLTTEGRLMGHFRALAFHNLRREMLRAEVLEAAKRLDEKPSTSDVASTSTAAPTPPSKDAHSNQATSMIALGVAVPNYSSETALTDAARNAVLNRAVTAGLKLDKLLWKSLHAPMVKQGYVLVNYPIGVLLPWTPSSSNSKGITYLDKASRLYLVAACHEHCRDRLVFVSQNKTDIRNNVVPILSFAPDGNGKVKEVFLRDIKSTSKTGSQTKRKVKVESDSDSLEGDDNDELNEDKNVALLIQHEDEETPTTRPRRSNRSKSQPPTADIVVANRAKSQPPSVTVKKVSFQVPNQPSVAKASKSATVVADGNVSISSASHPAEFTSPDLLATLRNKAEVKPAISMVDLSDAVTAIKRQSPPHMDELRSKRPRYNDPTSTESMLPTVQPTHARQSTLSSTDASLASSVHRAPPPAPPTSALPSNTSHLRPASPPSSQMRRSTPVLPSSQMHPSAPVPPPSSQMRRSALVPPPSSEMYPSAPVPHPTPKLADGNPQYPVYSSGFQAYPHHQPSLPTNSLDSQHPQPPQRPQPPQPQFAPEQIQAFMAMMAASGFHFQPPTTSVPGDNAK